ncbi:MAG: prolyl-tRNA synthetase [candidate division Zixibacteria bacterium SM23_81]|nr:MAG: prolyl-tRNA synthetase [candidate division Zixibacteria bacterium SM23_81]
MRWTETFIPTHKEDPTEAEVISHKLMVRAGLMRKLTSGVYTYLPLGLRAIKKVEQIVREEMNRAGALELLMPILHPGELWQESGRWDLYGKELMKVTDRHQRNFALGPTHEEVITDLLRNHIRSYRRLPLTFYQIQTKFRDEIRPRFGVMRAREFVMKDAYSFHENEASLDKTYQRMYEAYARIFQRCGLSTAPVQADSGVIGGDVTHEFMVLADNGESEILSCECGYAATREGARSLIPPYSIEEKAKPLEKVNTPGAHTVEQVTEFLNVDAKRLIKTILYRCDDRVVAVLIRGDRDINEAKVRRSRECAKLEMATPEEILKVSGAPVGFTGPVGLKGVELISDKSLQGLVNVVVGANEDQAHLINTNFPRDFAIDSFESLHMAQAGDLCPACGKPLTSRRGIEVGQIFKLGTKYSTSMRATFLDQDGRELPFIMGCYGIGITRTVAAAIEQYHDEGGIIWPITIAPYQLLILPLNVDDEKTIATAEQLYETLSEAGLEILMDDRDERAGFKFKDADLIGIPLRLTVGEKSLEEGKVELKLRRDDQVLKIDQDKAVAHVVKLIHKERSAIENVSAKK